MRMYGSSRPKTHFNDVTILSCFEPESLKWKLYKYLSYNYKLPIIKFLFKVT